MSRGQISDQPIKAFQIVRASAALGCGGGVREEPEQQFRDLTPPMAVRTTEPSRGRVRSLPLSAYNERFISPAI